MCDWPVAAGATDAGELAAALEGVEAVAAAATPVAMKAAVAVSTAIHSQYDPGWMTLIAATLGVKRTWDGC
jgi:hypothetical protein